MSFLFENPLLLFALGVLAIIAAGIAAWHWWGGALQSRLRGKEKISVLIIKRQPKLEEAKFAVDENRYIVDEKNRQAWFLGNIQRAKKGEIVGVVITADSCIPQSPGVPRNLENTCITVEKNDPFMCSPRCIADIEKMHRQNVNTPLSEWLGMTAMAAVVAIMGITCIFLLPRLKDVF